jgi:hypothetical protein
MEVTIKNQSFKPYTDANGYTIDLYYSVSFKGHFGGDTEWHIFGTSSEFAQYRQSNSGYTVVLVTIDYPSYPFTTKYPDGSQLDFRVEAFTGYRREPTMPEIMVGIRALQLIRVESSGWSSIQVFTITSGSSSLQPSQIVTLSPPSVTFKGNFTQSPDQIYHLDFIFTNPFFTLGVVVLFTGVVVVVVLVFLRRHLKVHDFNDVFS